MKIAESDFWTSSKMQVRTIIIIINYNYYPYNWITVISENKSSSSYLQLLIAA